MRGEGGRGCGWADVVVEDEETRGQAPRMTGPEARPDVRGPSSSTSMASEGGREPSSTISNTGYVDRHVQDGIHQVWNGQDL